jgi:hypothetical protein
MPHSRSLLLGAAAAAVLVLPSAAFADAHSEIVTAATHAGLAAGATDIAGVHMHLHHALNCLVGPAGHGFDGKELNPCAQSGNGAIPDTQDAAKKAALQNAADKATAAIALNNLEAAQKAATDIGAMLKKDE